ncbi:hypothetical protein RNJ44_00387 [Nakaseomyces bracarensis]|uniref:Uncharacterized protein n=1 Tax=Nakaseomyces bracarensis TaxID=273131 RepID=A0ABR4NSF3_9SACH
MADALIEEFSGYVRALEERIRREVAAELEEKYQRKRKLEDEEDVVSHKRREQTIWPDVTHHYRLKQPDNATMLFWEELESLLVYLYSGVNITAQLKEDECRREACRAAQLICFTDIDSTEGKIRRISTAHRNIRAKYVENALHALLGRFCPHIILDPNEELVCTFEKPLSEAHIPVTDALMFKDEAMANYTRTIINIQDVLKENQVKYEDWSKLLWYCIPEALGRKFIEKGDSGEVKPWANAVLEIVKRWGTSRMEADLPENRSDN